jgi:hypothetical protein
VAVIPWLASGAGPAADGSGSVPALSDGRLAVTKERDQSNGLAASRRLGFQAETLDFDLLVAQLVREEILEPIVSSPFHFQIRRRNWTNPESVYAADDRLSLIAISREEQTARFRMVGLLSARISNPRLPEKRVQQIRKERDELERIYEATWLELENAIGSKAAEAIRKSVEETTEAGAVQLELPLEKKRNFDLEGEARCNQ